MEKELKNYMNYPKRGVPKKHGSNYYFNYNTGLQNQDVLYKISKENTYYDLTKDDPLLNAEVMLDPNTLSEDGTTSLHWTAWSHDGRYMAYQL